MEIRFAPFLYVVSLTFSISQTAYLVFRLCSRSRSRTKDTKKVAFLHQAIVSGLMLFLFLFNAYNLGGIFIGYGQGFVRYRSLSLTFYEKALQVLEILSESIQKSTLLLSTTLFLPVLSDMSRYFGDKKPSESFKKFIVTLSLLRIVFYPSAYLILRNSINAALYFIDTLNTAESCFLIYVFLGIYARYKKALDKEHVLHRFKRIIFESKIQDFRMVLVLQSLQLFIDSIYRTVVIFTTFTQQNVLNYLFLDYAYLMRLVFLSLQFYCILKMCLVEDDSLACQKEDSGAEKEPSIGQTKNTDKECALEPKTYHYFAQPNKAQSGDALDKKFTLF